jgi:hypothetical protein
LYICSQVISVLALSSWLFARDAQQLVIDPLEKMSNLVERLVSESVASAKARTDPRHTRSTRGATTQLPTLGPTARPPAHTVGA